jgi:hypothetical protein
MLYGFFVSFERVPKLHGMQFLMQSMQDEKQRIACIHTRCQIKLTAEKKQAISGGLYQSFCTSGRLWSETSAYY